MALIKLNNQSRPRTAGEIIKVQTNPITAFGNMTLTNSYVDVATTEHSFTRTVSNSKILITYNLKLNSLFNALLQLNRKIGSGSYAVVNVGATGTQGSRTSQGGILGQQHNYVGENAMAYGIHADTYIFLDETGEGLTDTTDAITYKITAISGNGAGGDALYTNISAANQAGYNYTTESSVTFMEIAA